MDKKKILDWLDEQEDELMAPVRLSGHPPTKYHLKEQAIINEIRRLIESSGERTVSREWVLSFRTGVLEEDGNISHTPYITTKDVFRLLSELNIEVKP